MVSHAEAKKILICFTHTYPKGRKQSKFDLGSETRNKFSCDPAGKIAVDVRDNTTRVKGAMIDASRRGTDPLSQGELTTLRSIRGFVLDSVALQSKVKNATIATLTDANGCVALAHQNADEVSCNSLQVRRNCVSHSDTCKLLA